MFSACMQRAENKKNMLDEQVRDLLKESLGKYFESGRETWGKRY